MNAEQETTEILSDPVAMAAINADKANPNLGRPLSEAIRSLRSAGGDAWDDVEDVEAFLDDMCGPR